VESVFAQDGADSVSEVIVVADRCRDGTEEMISALSRTQPRLKLLRASSPGPAAARNAGVAVAQSDLVAFLDDDVTCAPSWLKGVLRRFEDSTVTAVEGAIRVTPGRHPLFSHFVENTSGGLYLTANLICRRSAFLEVGGFDEHFRQAGREDTQLAWKLMERGCRIMFAPEVVVTHAVLAGDDMVFIRYARRAPADVLLWRMFPDRYRKAGFHVVPRSYPLNFLGWLIMAAGIALRSWPVVLAGVAGLWLFLAYAVAARARGRRVTAAAALRLACQFLWIPWLHLWGAVTGWWRTRKMAPSERSATPDKSGKNVAGNKGIIQ
jgi:GT2 family glycosyltransferase